MSVDREQNEDQQKQVLVMHAAYEIKHWLERECLDKTSKFYKGNERLILDIIKYIAGNVHPLNAAKIAHISNQLSILKTEHSERKENIQKFNDAIKADSSNFLKVENKKFTNIEVKTVQQVIGTVRDKETSSDWDRVFQGKSVVKVQGNQLKTFKDFDTALQQLTKVGSFDPTKAKEALLKMSKSIEMCGTDVLGDKGIIPGQKPTVPVKYEFNKDKDDNIHVELTYEGFISVAGKEPKSGAFKLNLTFYQAEQYFVAERQFESKEKLDLTPLAKKPGRH